MSDNLEGKKPIYKKWWFWLIIVIVVIAILGGSQLTTNNTQTSTQTNESNNQLINTVTQTIDNSQNEDTSVSKEYRNALAKAKSYSDTMHMSKQAIYDQLTSEYGEKFTPEEAQYAIDNLE